MLAERLAEHANDLASDVRRAGPRFLTDCLTSFSPSFTDPDGGWQAGWPIAGRIQDRDYAP